jgi:hypothetical protein
MRLNITKYGVTLQFGKYNGPYAGPNGVRIIWLAFPGNGWKLRLTTYKIQPGKTY